MSTSSPSKVYVERMFSTLGTQHHGDKEFGFQIIDERFYKALSFGGATGLGESYMNGWWSCKDLAGFLSSAIRHGLLTFFSHDRHEIMLGLRHFIWNNQSRRRATQVTDVHYDPGSDVILNFLDPYNQYTCGYWKTATDLNTAQKHKLDLNCRKLYLNEYDKVLDVGCGWGGFAKYAAEHFDCDVTGITIAQEQIPYARAFCKGLPVNIMNCDYRDLDQRFDKILVCGMSEHVGYKNYRTLAQCLERCLERGGIFLWHTISMNNDSVSFGAPWLDKYIFPNGMVPTPARIIRATEGLFDLVDAHEFGEYYTPTLLAWRANFEKSWQTTGKPGRTEMDRRMWYYYLSFCSALFENRILNLTQFVFQKAKCGGYVSVR